MLCKLPFQMVAMVKGQVGYVCTDIYVSSWRHQHILFAIHPFWTVAITEWICGGLLHTSAIRRLGTDFQAVCEQLTKAFVAEMSSATDWFPLHYHLKDTTKSIGCSNKPLRHQIWISLQFTVSACTQKPTCCFWAKRASNASFSFKNCCMASFSATGDWGWSLPTLSSSDPGGPVAASLDFMDEVGALWSKKTTNPQIKHAQTANYTHPIHFFHCRSLLACQTITHLPRVTRTTTWNWAGYTAFQAHSSVTNTRVLYAFQFHRFNVCSFHGSAAMHLRKFRLRKLRQSMDRYAWYDGQQLQIQKHKICKNSNIRKI